MEVNDMTQFAYEASKKSEPTKEFTLTYRCPIAQG